MSKFKDEQIIKEVRNTGYIIKADSFQYIWTDEMFEDIKEEQMDNNALQINMNNLTDEERTTLLSLVEKANKPVNKVWKPEVEEKFYTLFGDGSIYELTWFNNADRIKRYEIGNYFKTKDEAKFALERQKVITELKRYTYEHNEKEIDWRHNTQKRYCIYYDYDCKKVMIFYGCIALCNNVYFTSIEIAQAAIKAIGEDRLKKYYFEVND